MKRIIVLGLGKSGFAAARLLARSSENDVYAWDSKSEDAFDPSETAELRDLGVKLIFGDAPAESFDKAVFSPGVPLDIPFAKRLKEEGCFFSGELEESYLASKGSFFAITGTNGKTTTTALVGEMVKAAGIPCEVVGNIGLPVADVAQISSPDTVMVTEVSSFQLETVHSFHAHVSAILNITPDHLNRHGSFEEYARVKSLICSNQTKDDYFIYNADDEYCCEIAGRSPATAVPFSRTKKLSFGAFVENGRIVAAKEGVVIDLCGEKELYIPGKHNLENALAAAAIAVFGGIDPAAVSSALKNFKGVEHRIEFIREYKGVRYVNDSKGTNPDASIKAIEATDTPIILIAGGYEKNSDFTEFIESFDGKVKYLLLLGVTAKRFAECAVKCGFDEKRIFFCENMEECFEYASKLAESGDTLLLSPASASWGMYNNYEERGDHFRRLAEALK